MVAQREVQRARTRLLAAAGHLPDIEVGVGHGTTTIALRGTRFVFFWADHHGDGELACWIRAPKDEQRALVAGQPGRYFVPPYVGPKGWIGVRLDRASQPDWDEIKALLEQGWRMGATKRALAAFDG